MNGFSTENYTNKTHILMEGFTMTYLEKYKASLERSQKLIKQFQHEFWEEHSMSKEDFEELVTALGEHIDHAEKMIELFKDEEQK